MTTASATAADPVQARMATAANLARKLGIPPEEALRGTLGKFITRFAYIETALARQGVPHGGATLEEMDRLWDEAKALSRQNPRTS